MRIQVLRDYGGRRTNDQRILPGVYDVGDECLFGLEDYLVNDQGVAVFLDPPAEQTSEGAPPLEFNGRTLETNSPESEPPATPSNLRAAKGSKK